MLEKEKGYLEEMIKVNEVEPLPQKLLRKKKVLAGALARMLCDREEPEPEEPEQPPLPLMRNNDQRKEWLRDYKSWGRGIKISTSAAGITNTILTTGRG